MVREITAEKKTTRLLSWFLSAWMGIIGTNVKATTQGNTSFDLLLPLHYVTNKLLFAEIKLSDFSGTAYGGNFYFGFRQSLNFSDKMWGIYTAIGRYRSNHGNYFNQLTLGSELWLKKTFISGNFYCPIGQKEKTLPVLATEKAMNGGDIKIGYELATNLMGYIGGYYYNNSQIAAIYGPQFGLEYSCPPGNHHGLAKLCDRFSFTVEIRKDKIRGTLLQVGVKIKAGRVLGGLGRLQEEDPHLFGSIHSDTQVATGIIRTPQINNLITTNTTTPKEIKEFDNNTQPHAIEAQSVNLDYSKAKEEAITSEPPTLTNNTQPTVSYSDYSLPHGKHKANRFRKIPYKK